MSPSHRNATQPRSIRYFIPSRHDDRDRVEEAATVLREHYKRTGGARSREPEGSHHEDSWRRGVIGLQARKKRRSSVDEQDDDDSTISDDSSLFTIADSVPNGYEVDGDLHDDMDEPRFK